MVTMLLASFPDLAGHRFSSAVLCCCKYFRRVAGHVLFKVNHMLNMLMQLMRSVSQEYTLKILRKLQDISECT